MSKSDGSLNATQGSLLGFLHDGPRTGWELLEAMSAGFQRFWNVTSSHVYRELKALEDRALIRAGARGKRDRRPYTITRAGKAAFTEWIRVAPGPEQIRVPLLVTLWFARHLDDDTLAEFLEAQRVEHESRVAAYRSFDAQSVDDPHLSAVVGFGIAYENAFLRWLEELPFARRPADQHLSAG